MTNELATIDAMPPAQMIEAYQEQARAIMSVVDNAKWYAVISGKKYLQVEAWQTIGKFNGVSPAIEWTRPIVQDDATVAYEAMAILVNRDGLKVGQAQMMCGLDESVCRGKSGSGQHLAAMSMAQTRAVSKAFRMSYSFVAVLANFEPTTAEEMSTQAPESNGEHFCRQHQTEWFMRGKMRSYGHPISVNGSETGEWCHESESTPGMRSAKDEMSDEEMGFWVDLMEAEASERGMPNNQEVN